MKILVRNLARLTTEEELKGLFQVFGKVQSCSLVIDPVSGESKVLGLWKCQKQAKQRLP